MEKHVYKSTDSDAGEMTDESVTCRQSMSSGDITEASVDHNTINDEILACSKRNYSTINEVSDIHDNNDYGEPVKISKVDATSIIDSIDDVWLQLDKNSLTMFDKAQLSEGNRLNDHHINGRYSLLAYSCYLRVTSVCGRIRFA